MPELDTEIKPDINKSVALNYIEDLIKAEENNTTGRQSDMQIMISNGILIGLERAKQSVLRIS